MNHTIYRYRNPLTYQDFLDTGENTDDRLNFIRAAIDNHQRTEAYIVADAADDYMRKKNRTIADYQRLLYKVTGEAVPDIYGANYKLYSSFYFRFITQQVQFSLGNGIKWKNKAAAEKALGNNLDFVIRDAANDALNGGVSFLFFNLDHVEEFSVREFVPLSDEETGALSAGVRWWQIDRTKPLRATLYELDGYTDYIYEANGKGRVLHEKRPYILHLTGDRKDEAENTQIAAGENYPGFPIVPCYGNPLRQSELIGIRESIDAYDLIKSGYCNNVDEASIFFWTVQNAGGMNDIDLAKFVERMKTLHASYISGDDGAKVESHTMEAPYESREALLKTLSADLYRDFMTLDTAEIAGGATTATQIVAGYEPMNSKADLFEGCILEALYKVMALAGVEDEPTFQRSYIINQTEEIQSVLLAAAYLPETYVTEKILTILGDGDRAEEIIRQMEADEYDRLNGAAGTTDGGNNGI